jgi:hypothetical protein
MKKFIQLLIFSLILCLTHGTIRADKWIGEAHTGNSTKSVGGVTAGCVPATTSTELDLNNVRALIHTGGDMWWDLQGTPRYEIPNGSGKTALFAGSIWIGGTDVNGQLKLAALRFRSGGVDYWPGPLITTGPDKGTTTSEVCLEYDKHFNITRNEVAEFRLWYNTDPETRAEDFPGYSIPDVILNWPAHGNTAEGYDYHLAPFKDVDGDDFYDPYAGDYPYYDLDQELPCGTSREQRIPRLFGDQTLWWVYNDRGNIHTETKGDAIGMEIRAQAFAFSTNDELNDMTFYNYALINRSTYTLIETYFGVWTDADMGYAYDDYVGCDVGRGLGYLYNGTAIDGSGQINAYGGPTPPPPAVGVDFFEGPYQDPDGIDNPSSYDPETGELNCNTDILNGNINGLNFGDGVADNERWGMRRYLYFNNGSAANPMTDPSIAPDYYNYLRGIWKDGSNMRYGGTGHLSDAATTSQVTDFMFPGDTDPCGWGQGGIVMPDSWSETDEQNPVGDRRFVQSAGPFTLEPGAVNDITTGIVWARATGGSEFESVEQVRIADDKAQLLFDNCFKVVDGPDAPDLNYIEMDKEIVFHIFNLPNSNNYLEEYEEKDFSIVNVDVDNDGTTDVVDKFYRFEGYQVYQLKDASVSVSDINNINLARQVYQCDVKNDVEQLVNFTWSEELNANIPAEMVNGANEGIEHSFTIREDQFATGDKRLVNHKKYYFMAIAYGYNNYKKYDQNDGASIKGQKKPYIAGRKGALGSIQVNEIIPHIPDPRDGGSILNSNYGDFLPVTQHEGFGSGDNVIDLTEETLSEIMSGPPWKTHLRHYMAGAAPIQVKVVDPLNIPEGDFVICIDPDSALYNDGEALLYRIKDGDWYIYQTDGDLIDTIYSESGIAVRNEQIIPELGLSIIIEEEDFPATISSYDLEPNLGRRDATITYENLSSPWLRFVADGDDYSTYPERNWIRSGTQADEQNPDNNDYKLFGSQYDEEESFEKFLNGTWAPYKIVSNIKDGPGREKGQANINYSRYRLASIDIVVTADKSKWTRSAVLELSENDSIDSDDNGSFDVEEPSLFGQGDAYKFELRDTFSIDKEGNFATAEDTVMEDENSPAFIRTRGMGWFPGYAIDVETGTRLNIVYGEASNLPGENGRDMKWNPTGRTYSNFGETLFGGKHYIYILGQNYTQNVSGSIYNLMPGYDQCQRFFTYYDSTNAFGNPHATAITKAYQNFMYCAIPFTSTPGNMSFEDALESGDVTIRIRMANPIRVDHGIFAKDSADMENQGFPKYSFSTKGFATTKNDVETAKDALDLIKVVPNPYYGYSEYELNQLENLIKITNLPQSCTISIYNVNGTLVRRFKKDSQLSYQDWDLKNQYGIPIASGVYIIHVDAYELGEKILKWFGAMRPVDLNAF